MTPAEQVLWQKLRDRRLNGIKFRRQHLVGPYVLDFCCLQHRLAIEVDGAVHDEQIEYDQARTEYLAAWGYRILRFRNDEVSENLAAVLERIVAKALSDNS